MKKVIFTLLGFAAVIMTGCAAIQPVSPEVNNKMIATNNPPPRGCKYLGQVLGNQGNFFTGSWTSNANLEQGAMTDLKNKAYALGANYVQIITNRAGNTGSSSTSWNSSGSSWSSGSSQQTNVTSTGNAFKCPPKIIGLE